MRATKKLEKCTEVCKYCSGEICVFGLRDIYGCFLDKELQLEAGRLLEKAKEINTLEIIKVYSKCDEVVENER